MNAEPLLNAIARAIAHCKLEAILIGNAAAALHGAPVTTVDVDFFFRKTPVNLRKLKRFADQLDATILRPYYPASGLYRVINDEQSLQIDFMSAVHGIRSYSGLRARSGRVVFAGNPLWIAPLKDIIASKKAANRPRDIAVVQILEQTLREKERIQNSGS